MLHYHYLIELRYNSPQLGQHSFYKHLYLSACFAKIATETTHHILDMMWSSRAVLDYHIREEFIRLDWLVVYNDKRMSCFEHSY